MEATMLGVQPTMPVQTSCNDMFGGGSFITILIVLLLLGGNLGGLSGNRQTATTDELSAGFNFAGVNGTLKDIMLGQANTNQIFSNGLCQSTYEISSKIDNGNSQILMAIKDLGSSIKDDKIAEMQQTITQMQIQLATCGIPKVNPYSYGTYQYPCFANSSCGVC